LGKPVVKAEVVVVAMKVKKWEKEWMFRMFDDGNQQWVPQKVFDVGDAEDWIVVERVVSTRKYPRKKTRKWCVVDRGATGEAAFAPKVAGPFPNLRAACSALKLIHSKE
jgi:hypothetical protein